MGDRKESPLTRILNAVRRQFIIGFIVAIPLGVTVIVILWIFRTIDNLLQPIIMLIFKRSFPGIGIIAALLLIYIAGAISSNVVGSQLIRFGETLLTRLPVVRTLYTSVKEVVFRLSQPDGHNFLRVVFVEYPRKGVMSLAFITSETSDRSGKRLLSLLIPTAPNPLSGYVIVVPEDEIIPTNISINAAMRMLISCGAILPSETNGAVSLKNWLPPLPKEKPTTSEGRDG